MGEPQCRKKTKVADLWEQVAPPSYINLWRRVIGRSYDNRDAGRVDDHDGDRVDGHDGDHGAGVRAAPRDIYRRGNLRSPALPHSFEV